MPLPVLLILVIGGIAAIALLLHLSGRSELCVLDTDSARQAWLRHFPDDLVGEITLARNRHAALVTTDEGTGLLWAFGADTVARHLRDFDLIETPGGLDVAFHDYTAPRVRLTLEADERAAWERMMTDQDRPT